SKNSTSRAFLADLRQSDTPVGIVEEEREWASWGPEWIAKSDNGRYPTSVLGQAANTFESVLKEVRNPDETVNGDGDAAAGDVVKQMPLVLCMPSPEIHKLALRVVRGKIEGRLVDEPPDGISVDMAMHTLYKILQPFVPTSTDLEETPPTSTDCQNNITKIFDDVAVGDDDDDGQQHQSSSRPVFLTQTQYSLLRYYHTVYSRLARASYDIARLRKQQEQKQQQHQQQQQQQHGQKDSVSPESPPSLPDGGDNTTLSTDNNNMTLRPGAQGVDSLVDCIAQTFSSSSSDPSGVNSFNNIVREHLGFNRGYYLYTMPKVLARMAEALQLVCLGRADVVSKRKTTDSGSRAPRRDSATQRVFALNESIKSVKLNHDTAREL
ncbi:hypothetical protein FOZ62_005468, partial [Perkinsus olseni]